jgi:uncharacterized protein YkwD
MYRLSLICLLALTTLAPRANAQGYSAANIPTGAMQKLGELANAGQSLRSIAFTTDGGWAILYGNNGYAWAGIPDAAAQKLQELSNAGQSLQSIAFAPGGGWAILQGGGGGTTSTPGAPTADALRAMEDQVFALVNQARAQAGLAPLTRSPELDAAARRQSLDMATTGNLDHTGSDGSTFGQRAQAAGYLGFANGENLVWGFDTAEGAMNWWMNSANHRASILSQTSNQIGISVVYQAGTPFRYYWTQVFGAR